MCETFSIVVKLKSTLVDAEESFMFAWMLVGLVEPDGDVVTTEELQGVEGGRFCERICC